MADTNEKDNLLYRPIMEPNLDWMSDGDFNRPDTPLEIPDTPTIPDQFNPRRISEDLQEIIELFPAIPPGLQFLKPTIEKIKARIDYLYPNGSDPKTYPDAPKVVPTKPDGTPDYNPPKIIPTGPTTHINIPNVQGIPPIFPDPPPLSISVKPPESIVDIVKTDYAKDQIHLDSFYTQRLQLVIQKYFQRILMSMADCGLENIDDITRNFDGEAVKIPPKKGLEHLRDHIVRSQVGRDQRERLFSKTHSVDKTLMHMRAWHAAEKARERYYGESYGDSGSFAGSHANALLRDNRKKYDQAYTSTLYNMFRYLDSSTQVMNDTLEMTANEAEAKSQLVKNGVNIFETNETDDVANATAQLNAEATQQTADNEKQAAEAEKNLNKDTKKDDKDKKDETATTDGTKTDDTKTDDKKTDDTSKAASGIMGGVAGGIFGSNKNGGNVLSGALSGIFGDTSNSPWGKPVGDDKSDATHGPNGKAYEKNDIDYLVNQGYTEEDAKAFLSTDKKYAREEYTIGTAVSGAVQKAASSYVNNIFQGAVSGVTNAISNTITGIHSFNDLTHLGQSFSSNFQQLGRNLGKTITEGASSSFGSALDEIKGQAKSYAGDWLEKKVTPTVTKNEELSKKMGMDMYDFGGTAFTHSTEYQRKQAEKNDQLCQQKYGCSAFERCTKIQEKLGILYYDEPDGVGISEDELKKRKKAWKKQIKDLEKEYKQLY